MAKHGKNIGVVLYENETFFSAACSSDGRVLNTTSLKGGMSPNIPDQVPDEIFSWFRGEKCGRLRFLLGGSPKKNRFSPPSGLSPYELEKSIGFEYGAVCGLAPGSLRGAALPVESLDGRGEGVFAFGVADKSLQGISEACSKAGFVFEGAGSLILAWLQLLMTEASAQGEGGNDSYLYLGTRTAELFTPSRAGRASRLRSLTIGTRTFVRENWAELFVRYRSELEHATIKVLTSSELPVDFADRLGEQLTLSKVVELDWAGQLEGLCALVASVTPAPYSATCPLILYAEAQSVGYKKGHYVSFILLMLALVGSGGFWGMNEYIGSNLQELVDQEAGYRKSAAELNKQVVAVRQNMTKQGDLRALLERADRIDEHYVEILTAIKEVVPKGLRVSWVAIRPGGIKIEGIYRRQEDQATFGARLQERLSSLGLRVVPEKALSEGKSRAADQLGESGKFSLRIVR